MAVEHARTSTGDGFWSKPWIGPVLSALLLTLAFAGLWPLLFVALLPWLLSLQGATPRQAWNRGYGFGLLFSLTQLWWLGDLAYKWIGNPILGVVPWLLASLLSAVYYGLLGRLVRGAPRWAIPLVWAGMEAFRSYIPVFAFPWALLAEPLVGTPFRGLAWFGTIYFVSAFVVAINVALASSHQRGTRLGSLAGAAAILLGIWWGVSGQGKRNPLPKVAAGQIGVDMAFEAATANLRIPPAVEALTAEARTAGAEILVLPEGLGPAGKTVPPYTPFRIPNSPALVFGEQREGPKAIYQSAFAHDQAAGWSFADKTRLVIFGEFVPGRDVFPFLQSAFHLPGGDLSAGDKLSTLTAAGQTVGPLICFEALFPDLGLRQARAGATILATMSIDDWFALPARERLADAARWRAVEAGLPLVRAGSLGRTRILDARGEILAEAPFGGRRLVVAQPGRGPGPFALVWLFPATALASLIAVPLAKRRRAMGSDATISHE